MLRINRRATIAGLLVSSATGAFATPPAAARTAASQADAVNRLEREVRRIEAVRAVKRLQHAFAQYIQVGLWNDAADLFAVEAEARYPSRTLKGREEIRAYLMQEIGRGRIGLEAGRLHTPIVLSPVISIEGDLRRAKGRWREFVMIGEFGKEASWAGGLYENSYVFEEGAWKIGMLHYYPRFSGSYEEGWRSVEESRNGVVPFHYTSPLLYPSGAASAAPPAASPNQGFGKTAAQLTGLEQRIQHLNDEAEIRNLQNAYGYYVDRKMWDDVIDLFANDCSYETEQSGVYVGKSNIRRALERAGSAGLKPNELNDHLQMEAIVTIAPGGRTARARGVELGMTGKNQERGFLTEGVFDNRYVKDNGVWKLASVHVYMRARADYEKGWATSAEPAAGPDPNAAADGKASVAYASYPAFNLPPISYAHPVTRKAPQLPAEAGKARIEPAGLGPAPRPAQTATALGERLNEAERRLRVADAYDGAEHVSNAYGYYIDEFLWIETGNLFSEKGYKELSYVGTFVGRDRVTQSMIIRYGLNGRSQASMTLHQKTQPVVHPAPDGRSARIRTRLFQMNSSFDAPGSYIGGIYENQIVWEDGAWKISGMDLDYTWQTGYVGAWVRVQPSENRRFAPRTPDAFASYPPDRPLRGVTYAPYPDVAEMAFHYRNPVSGRAPPALLS